MNKYLILMFVLIALVVGGVGYRTFLLPDSQKPVDTGIVKEFTVLIEKNSWSFTPEVIDVDLGDTVKMRFVNNDDYDHGVGIDAYGVSQRIPARATLDVPPFVASKAGDFQFYCSVSCSEGIAENGLYKGVKRSHFDQIGTICVHKTPGDRVCQNSAPIAPIPGAAVPAIDEVSVPQ
jgi:plastocyanin